jgi:transposase
MTKYSKEFKEEALKLSDEIGVKKAAEQLGLQYYTLADWRKLRKLKIKNKVVFTEDEASRRISELERENRELKQANDILKDALGFFAKDRKR